MLAVFMGVIVSAIISSTEAALPFYEDFQITFQPTLEMLSFGVSP